jgi:hypothetical protein
MSLADQLLIGWWVAIPIVGSLAWFAAKRRDQRQDAKAAILAYTRGVSLQELRYRPQYGGNFFDTLLWIFIAGATLTLVVSFFVILWMHAETKLYLLHTALFLLAASIMAMGAAFVRKLPPFPFFGYQPVHGSIGDKLLRLGGFGGGVILFVLTGNVLFHDIMLPPVIVEGRITDLEIDKRLKLFNSPDYRVWVDGSRHSTTNDVYSGLRIGDRVRAEIGSGSDMIFRVQPVVTTR